MNENWMTLIRFLLKSEEPVMGKRLAEELGVSTRTIRNYIREINGLNNSQLIHSDDTGYSIGDRLAATEVLRINREVGGHVPQNEDERYAYIIKRLLRDQTADAFDLANELYISFSTLKRTLRYINNRLQKWHTKIVSDSDRLSLQGEESSKRQLFSYLIYRENTGNLLSIDYLREAFGDRMTLDLQTCVDSVIQEFNLSINEFAYNNLLLHLLILVSRLSSGHTIERASLSGSDIGEYTKRLAEVIQQKFNTSIFLPEAQEIDILLKSNANLPVDSSRGAFYGEEFSQRIDLIVKKVRALYMVDLSSPKFIQPFSIHMHNLLYRLKSNHMLRNPIRPGISNNFPLIYDIATYISFQIRELWGEKVPEDETAFVALHVGAEIERQKHTPEKLSALLIAPDYLNTHERVREFLRINFSRDIRIVKETESVSQADDLNPYDIVFSSLSPSEATSLPSYAVTVDPFDLESQKSDVQAAIDHAYLWKKKRLVKDKFFSFFSPELFWKLDRKATKQEILEPTIAKMREAGVVSEHFLDEIMERESMGSTAFNRIAIPHPMSFSSPQTKVAVILDEAGIDWGGSTVNMVYIISISAQYKDEFRSIYENLMDFLSDDKRFDVVLKANSLEDFYQRMLS